jgi:hypothetical protein
MDKVIVNVNELYYIKITFNDDIRRLYQLIHRESEKTILESFSRDAFLLKANKIIKLSNKIELIVASV